MVRRTLVLMIGAVAVLASASRAQAQPAARATPAAAVWQRVQAMLEGAPDDLKDARFAFDTGELRDDPVSAGALASTFEGGAQSDNLVVAFSANGEAAWVAVDLATFEVCGDETCPKVPKPNARYHATALVTGGAPWQPVMWHVGEALDSKAYAAAKLGTTLDEVPARIGRADAAVALFRATIGDPAALAKTVSTRADVVLYGTDRKERYVGGKKVAATLKKWSLAFTVVDGLVADTTASGTIAWVAANVDAVSTKKPRAKPDPYRMTAIYEKTDAGWKLVNLQFSYPR